MARKPKGWHPEDIKAAVRKSGITLTALALDNELPSSACRVALKKPYYVAEQAISRRLKISAKVLWPDRYDDEDQPLQPRIRANLINGGLPGHGQKARAA